MLREPTEPTSRREAAAGLADELLADIELSRIPAVQVARKAGRLARLLDDEEAVAWLRFETGGFTHSDSTRLTAEAFQAAWRSGRGRYRQDGGPIVEPSSLGQLEAEIAAGKAQLAAAADPDISLSSANPHQFVGLGAAGGNSQEREAARAYIGYRRAIVDKVVGSIHHWVSEKHLELRFGAAVETAFGVVRSDVDAAIAELVPEGLGMLSAALENASSDNPEHWANAASTSRRLLKAAADALRPPGPDVDGRKMGDPNYINRLIAWLTEQPVGGTQRDLTTSDLEHLGARLDAANEAGHKGAHSTVTREEASRFVVGTYLVLGDLLRAGGRLADGGEAPAAEG